MNDTVLANVRVLEPGEGVIAAWVRIRAGKVIELGPADQTPGDAAERFDGGGRLLTPGLIDIHTHGIEQYGYETSPEQIVAASRRLGRYGTTCVLPTLCRRLSRPHLAELEKLAAALNAVEEACFPGFHFEGPFLAHAGAGVETGPGDVGLLDELYAAVQGKMLAMSVSPEAPNILPVIERLCELGVVPMITHTRATVEQTTAAIDAGARHATHFYDVFFVPEETDLGVRPVGAVEAILADSRCSVDFIADGVHVHPTAILATLAAKGFRNVILATDSNIGAGLPPGKYPSPLGEVITGSAARLHRPGQPLDGVLAGSTLTLDRAVANLFDWFRLPEEQVWAMASANPARLLRLTSKGTLRPGADADLVLWEEEPESRRPQAVRTWVAGRCVYSSTA